MPYARSYAERRMALLEKFGGCCEVCHARAVEAPLEFAHIKPTINNGRGRGSDHRLLEVIRNPEAFALLCRGCHGDFDAGRITVRGLTSHVAPCDPDEVPY